VLGDLHQPPGNHLETLKGDRKGQMSIAKQLHNPHAGDILKSEFLDESGMSQNALACQARRWNLLFCGETAALTHNRPPDLVRNYVGIRPDYSNFH